MSAAVRIGPPDRPSLTAVSRESRPSFDLLPQDAGDRRTIPGAIAPLYNPRESRALSVCSFLAVAAVLWIAHPVAVGLFVGALGAFTMQPLHRRLRARFGGRVDWSALMCTLLAGVSVVGAAALLFGLVVYRGGVVAAAIPRALDHGGPLDALSQVVARSASRYHLHVGDLGARLGESAGSVAAHATAVATAVAAAAFHWILGLIFALITLHFTLVHWSALTQRIENVLPLHPRHTHALFDEFRRVGRSVLAGTVLTGLAQGLLAGIGFALTGVPEPALLGALTAVASLLPGVGTLVVWVPAGLYLILTHHPGRGVAELLWGVLVVVVVSDYVIRPRLVGGSTAMPTLLTFIALFGGVEAFGIIGLLLGPVLMALALAVLRIYERESVHRRAHAAEA